MGTMTIEVRTITDADVPDWSRAVATGFHHVIEDGEAEFRRSTIVLDRTWAAFEGDRAVATLRSFPAETTVPGGIITASAVTSVTTTATHRRHGLASRMMAGELAASRERGEPAANLIAAEYPIYGRFGFGPAAWSIDWKVDSRGTLPGPWRPAGSVELVDVPTGRALAPDLQRRARLRRPGDIEWPDRYFDFDFNLARVPGEPERKPFFTLLARDEAGEPSGLALFRVEEKWENWQPFSTATVSVMIAPDPHAFALIWHYLVSLDGITQVEMGLRPVDETVPWLLADGRRAQQSGRNDYYWVRPLDVPAYLTARRYPVAGRLVLEVVDPLGLSGGRFAVDGSPDGATCAPTDESADLTVPVSSLGSLSLGGVSAQALASVGRIDEHTPGAVTRAGLMFAWPVAPWCSVTF